MSLISGIKFALGLAVITILRMIQMPLPNIEPIMATMLPFAKKYGKIAGFVFASVALASFDFISGRLGMWTIYCAIAYGAIGFAAGKYFANKKTHKMRYYLGFGVIGTIFYDAVTALLFGFQFGQPLAVTIAGQIPFTLYHLMGNMAMIAILSPLVTMAIV
ncbi:MAG: hypothetical protein V1658_03670, partial [Candidatus Micrarchaeota archaeon]